MKQATGTPHSNTYKRETKKKCNYFTTTMTKYKMELMKKKTIKHFFFIFEYNVYLI